MTHGNKTKFVLKKTKITQSLAVCTTELGEAALRKMAFERLRVKLCGFSCNDADSHKSWINDIKSVTGGDVDFPLFCDPDRSHASALGVLDESNKNAEGLPMTVRSVFILKPKTHQIALMMTYPASTGRNFDEIIRVIQSLQLTADENVATPVDWKQGEDVIVNYPLTNAEADDKFGKGGWRKVDVPSEEGKDLPKNYLRYTSDPTK
jgi:thioredoxin-dependent peroxiredoxin